jgi:hypothetical protein
MSSMSALRIKRGASRKPVSPYSAISSTTTAETLKEFFFVKFGKRIVLMGPFGAECLV